MTSLSIHSYETRLLYPFYFEVNQLANVKNRLQNTQTPKNKPIWENIDGASVHEFYRQEMLETAERFVFGSSYWHVNVETLNSWFGKGIEINFGKDEPFEVTCSGQEGIELFLSDYGVGVLSVKLATKNPKSPEQMKQVNYRVSQGGRLKTIPTWALPYQANPNAPPPPAPDAPLTERLGKRGGQFTLPKLVEYLLSAFENAELKPLHPKFKVFTVVRLSQQSDDRVNFLNAEVADHWRPLLYGLAHIEEIAHVGTLATQNQLLNPNHWAAVTSLASAHLLIDQYHPAKDFDAQRVPTVLYKYFIHYLMALLQDSILQGFLNKAAQTNWEEQANLKEHLGTIHSQHLRFSASGYFIETSVREANNQFYRLAQQGLRVPETFLLTQQVFQDIEVSSHLRQQQQFEEKVENVITQLNQNVNTVTAIQRKVEWLEVFFASYYACALAYYIAPKLHFCSTYQAFSVVAWPIVAGVLVFIGVKPYKSTHESAEKLDLSQWIVITLAIILPFVWLIVGILCFQEPC